MYAADERRESAEEGEDEEDEEEEEGREEEEEQRPLCSGVLGYPVVRDHSVSLGLSGAADAPAADTTYKGDDGNDSQSFIIFILGSRRNVFFLVIQMIRFIFANIKEHILKGKFTRKSYLVLERFLPSL